MTRKLGTYSRRPAVVEMQRRLASATLLFNKEGISLGVDPLLRQRRDESLVSPIPDQREHPERAYRVGTEIQRRAEWRRKLRP
jgi:hypothetical protein